MTVNKLVGTQVSKYAGPILVVGGAPSAPAELEMLRKGGFDFESCLIISANEHAIHLGLKPQFACVNDDVHHTLNEFQEPRMRRLIPDVKLLSRHWWADYRSPQLLACNSGLKAILYAAILGANPVIVIGIQHYNSGLYFHEEGGNKRGNPNLGRGDAYFGKQTAQLRAKLKGIPVRPVAGPLLHDWPAWNPDEKFPPRELGQLECKAQEDAEHMRYLYVKEPGYAFEAALVPQGMVFAVTKYELLERRGDLSVSDATDWDLSEMNKALAADLVARRAEQDRLRRMVAKVRASHRGVRRGIYDADIVRAIKWAEEGVPIGVVVSRSGLPLEQVKFVLKTAGVERVA